MKTAIILCAALLLAPSAALARTVEVKMLDNSPEGGPGFAPDLIRIAPGDSIHFVAVDKGHSVDAIPTMIPAGAKPFASDMSQDLTVTFDRPGLYGFKCAPHYAIGMVGLVMVGDRHNEAALKTVPQPGMAASAFKALFDTLDATPATRH